MQLIGWHTKRRVHSIHDNNEWMEAVEPQRVWINVDDAQNYGIEDEEVIEIYNDRGVIRMKTHVSARIMKGVICITQGAWYTPDDKGVERRGSINVLTTLQPTPLAKGNPQHSNLVNIIRGRGLDMAIQHNSSLCIGCRACQMACADYHNLIPSSGFMYIKEHESMNLGQLSVHYDMNLCRQCLNPLCLSACPKNAISINDKGIVVIDLVKCIGCGRCEKACINNSISMVRTKDGVRTKNVMNVLREKKKIQFAWMHVRLDVLQENKASNKYNACLPIR